MSRFTRRGYVVLVLALLSLISLVAIGAWLQEDITFVSFAVNIDTDVKNLPPDVVESVAQHWPRARIKSAQRIYGGDFWGDYHLTLALEGGDEGSPIISETGTVKAKG